MAVVVWEEVALADVDRLSAYIAATNPHAASAIRRALIDAGDSLEPYPLRGRPGLAPGTRELVVRGRYILVYEVVANEVRFSTSGTMPRVAPEGDSHAAARPFSLEWVP